MNATGRWPTESPTSLAPDRRASLPSARCISSARTASSSCCAGAASWCGNSDGLLRHDYRASMPGGCACRPPPGYNFLFGSLARLSVPARPVSGHRARRPTQHPLLTGSSMNVRRAVCVLLCLCAVAVALPGCNSGNGVGATAILTRVRVVNLIPNAAGITLTLDTDAPVVTGLGFQQLTQYLNVNPGTREFKVSVDGGG